MLSPAQEEQPELAAALDRLDEAWSAVSPEPGLLPTTAAEVSAAVLDIARMDSRERDISRALTDVLTPAFEGWASRAADARSLAEAARALLPYTNAQRAEVERSLGEAQDALPDDPPAPPPGWHYSDAMDPQARMDAARRALAPVVALEEASAAVLTAAAAAAGLQSRAAAARDLANAARTMLPYTGEQEPDLTHRLHEAERQLEQARPGWWRANGGGPATVADFEAAMRWLAGDEAAQVEAAVERFENVVADVATAANQTGARLLRLRRIADGQLPLLSGEQHRPLQLALRAAPIFDNWPGLPQVPAAEAPAAAAEMEDAAKQLADPPPSVERAETVIRNVIAAAIEHWNARLAALGGLAGRMLELLPESGERGYQFALRLQESLEYVVARDLQLAAAQVGTAAELDAAADLLAEVTSQVDIEGWIKSAIGVVIDEPILAAAEAANLGENADRLLPYVSEPLRDVLRAARADLERILPAPPPVASRPLAEMDAALSQAIERLQDVRTAVSRFWADVVPVLAAVRDTAGQARDVLAQASGRLTGERQRALRGTLSRRSAAC